MNADDLKADIVASLTVASMLRSAERPEGLTASAVGGCPAQAGFILRGDEPTDSGDPWMALLGTWIGDGIESDRASVNPDLSHQQRVSVDVAGITISGQYDEMGEDYIADWKTRTKDECRWHARYGADPQHEKQVGILATAAGKSQGFVVYAPRSGTLEDLVVCEVDVERAFAEARLWVRTVVENLNDRDNLPREKPSSWCERFCAYFSTCRGDFLAPDEEIVDDQLRAAVVVAWQTKQEKSRAEKDHAAAMAMLEHVDSGRVGGIRVVSNVVEPTEKRAGYTRREIKKVPGVAV